MKDEILKYSWAAPENQKGGLSPLTCEMGSHHAFLLPHWGSEAQEEAGSDSAFEQQNQKCERKDSGNLGYLGEISSGQ